MAPDLVTLSWCLGEIRESLAQADRHLGRQLESGSDDFSSLRAARASLHQAHGALQVVAIDGVPLLTQEAEHLLDAVERADVALNGDVVSRLQRAFHAVVEHCEALLGNAPAQPLHLFPYYRALLEARRAERIHPADLFFPDLAVRLPEPQADYAEVDEVALGQARGHFERGLLSLMREPGASGGTRRMCEAVDLVCGSRLASANRAFWWVTQAYFEALAGGRIPVDVEVKRLLARFNLQLRKTLQERAPVSERLVKDMLFALASLTDPTPKAQAVREAFSLKDAIPGDFAEPRYGRLDERVLRAAREGLSRARVAFDKVSRGSVGELASFTQAIDTFCDAAQQLPGEGLRALGRAFAQTRRKLNSVEAPLGDALALEIASAILFCEQALEHGARAGSEYDRHGQAMADRLLAAIEGTAEADEEVPDWLRSLSQAAQERLTMAAFVGETVNNLRGVEKVLDAFFRDHAQRDALPESVRALRQVGGALRLLGHDDAATGAEAVATRVAAFADDEGEPDQGACDRVAASVGAIGFFIDGLAHPERSSGRFELDAQTGEFRARFGRAEPEPAVREVDPGALGIAGPEAPAPASERIEPSAEEVLSAQTEQAASLFVALTSQPNDPALREQLHGTMFRVREAAMLIDDAPRRTAAAGVIALLADPHAALDLERLASALAAAGVAVPRMSESAAELPTDDATIDSELLEIFLSEAEEVLAAIVEHVELSRASRSEQQHLTTIRRGFHTLKGSSRMVGLTEFGDAGWAMEQVLNLWLAEERAGTDGLYQLIEEAHAQMGAWVALLVGGARAAAAIDPAPLIASAEALREGRPQDVSVPQDEFAQEAQDQAQDQAQEEFADEKLDFAQDDAQGVTIAVSEEPAAAVPEETQTVTAGIGTDDRGADSIELGDADVLASGDRAASGEMVTTGDDQAASEDMVTIGGDQGAADDTVTIGGHQISRALYMIFLSEADELIAALIADVDEWVRNPARGATDEAIRIAHSLAGSASVVLLKPVHQIAGRLEAFMLAQRASGEAPPQEDLAIAVRAIERIQAVLHQFAAGSTPGDESAAHQSVAELAARWGSKLAPGISDRVVDDPEFAFEAEAGAELESEAEAGSESDPESRSESESDWGMPAVESAGDAEAQEATLETVGEIDDPTAEPEPPAETVRGDATYDAIDAAMEELVADLPSAHQGAGADDEVLVVALEQWADTEPAGVGEAPESDGEQADAESSVSVPLPTDDLDAELLPVFVEEAEDYLPQIGENLRLWHAQPADEALPQTLMRHLHTVKGSARMAGAMGLGQLLHEIETRVEALVGLASVPVSRIDELIADHDRVAAMFDTIKQPPSAAPRQVAAPGDAAQPDDASPFDDASADAAAAAGSPVVERRLVERTPPLDESLDAPQAADPAPPAGARSASGATGVEPVSPAPRVGVPVPDAAGAQRAHPLVRVRADLLDKLVNEAGEVSIARSRLDNELTGLRQSLTELTENVNRLRSQLREIEIQAESQIQARIAQQREHEQTFDPLEFDRYTRFQELTRMLAESVNDVATVQNNATRNLEDASQDLHRQGQVLRDLQQNLMRVRMVQFGSIADRLYRVVRQSAKELDKRVHLDLRGSAVEVDRGVLEKMAGPIEHLLRNAVAHGIEPREVRTANGKSDTGEIVIEVRQEGREIILSFADDGKGLDFEKIRARALAAGLIASGSSPSERELADLIFMPGFTTATSVTEISGRGVGMDVVRAEVAALGGRIETESTRGEGTRFTAVLPLTLAVSQVVLVSVGRTRFAVPSSSVEQVLQLKPQALAGAYEQRSLEWQGSRVPLFYLGSLVELADLTPVAQHQSPVVIVRSGNQRIALHCDEVTRDQEVVVKSVGPQIARVRGISGATVLGNGDIVLIINPVAFAQAAAGEVLERAVASPSISAMLAEALPAIVMVVDDSLTVRKVTQRLLAREGYQVMLAKDGVDALRQLQDTVPDVMLVDIEMPRMDGFDLTRNLRADERFAHIPIVMITSRTADKHRNYAMSLGVNEYLGKPYAEEELLGHVAAFAQMRRTAALT